MGKIKAVLRTKNKRPAKTSEFESRDRSKRKGKEKGVKGLGAKTIKGGKKGRREEKKKEGR
jgi:hypothetical protein